MRNLQTRVLTVTVSAKKDRHSAAGRGALRSGRPTHLLLSPPPGARGAPGGRGLSGGTGGDGRGGGLGASARRGSRETEVWIPAAEARLLDTAPDCKPAVRSAAAVSADSRDPTLTARGDRENAS